MEPDEGKAYETGVRDGRIKAIKEVLKIIESTTESVMVSGNSKPYKYAADILGDVKAEVEKLV